MMRTNAIQKIEDSHYLCEAGPLALNQDWIDLKAEIERLRAVADAAVKLERLRDVYRVSHEDADWENFRQALHEYDRAVVAYLAAEPESLRTSR